MLTTSNADHPFPRAIHGYSANHDHRAYRRQCARSPQPSRVTERDAGIVGGHPEQPDPPAHPRPGPQPPLLPRHPEPGRLPGVRPAGRSPGWSSFPARDCSRPAGMRPGRPGTRSCSGSRHGTSAPGMPGWPQPASGHPGAGRGTARIDRDADRGPRRRPDRPGRGAPPVTLSAVTRGQLHRMGDEPMRHAPEAGSQRHSDPGTPCPRQLRTFTQSTAMYKIRPD